MARIEREPFDYHAWCIAEAQRYFARPCILDSTIVDSAIQGTRAMSLFDDLVEIPVPIPTRPKVAE